MSAARCRNPWRHQILQVRVGGNGRARGFIRGNKSQFWHEFVLTVGTATVEKGPEGWLLADRSVGRAGLLDFLEGGTDVEESSDRLIFVSHGALERLDRTGFDADDVLELDLVLHFLLDVVLLDVLVGSDDRLHHLFTIILLLEKCFLFSMIHLGSIPLLLFHLFLPLFY